MNRVVRDMLKDVTAVHYSRSDTRDLGYIDTNYWGFRFADRRSPFDLTPISQRWLRDLTWDYLADRLDGPRRPRRQGTFEQARRSLVCFSAFLAEHDPARGSTPATLSQATARSFVADFTRRVAEGEPALGMFNMDGSASMATPTTYSLSMNGLRRVMRWALESGAAEAAGLSREFIVALPAGGAVSFKNPRPFSDSALRELSDPANIALLAAMDPNDGGLADMWSIQVKCGRRISEVVGLRFDCVSEHLGRTWMWVDMTKVGKLDYAIQIPRDIYDLIVARQAKTAERFRLAHGTEPTAQQRRTVALFPSTEDQSQLRAVRVDRDVRGGVQGLDRVRAHRLAWPHHPPGPPHPGHQAGPRGSQHDPCQTGPRACVGADERFLCAHRRLPGGAVPPAGVGHRTGQPDPGPDGDDPHRSRKGFGRTADDRPGGGAHRARPVHVQAGSGRPRLPLRPPVPHLRAFRADRSGLRLLETPGATLGGHGRRSPGPAARDYIYETFERSSLALAGLEKALLALGLLDQARELDLRSPHQDFLRPDLDPRLAGRRPGPHRRRRDRRGL